MESLFTSLQIWANTYGLKILALIAVAIVANFIAKKILLTGITLLIKRSKNTWDDIFTEKRVFDRLSHLAPAIVIHLGSVEVLSGMNGVLLIQRFAIAYMMVVAGLVVDAFMGAMADVYERMKTNRNKPIKGYVQLVKIFLWLFISILVIATLMDRDPWNFLAGLGGMTAILLLVFKDSLMGLVSSVQISSYDMLRVGDWLEMPKYDADGDVIEISLNTIKVQNWDKTIACVPTQALTNNSFKNWRGMTESGGRRIKRSINIDMNTVRFCDEALLDHLSKFGLLKNYLAEKKTELSEFNQSQGVDASEVSNGRRLTNVGTFRAYIVSYLKKNPNIHEDMTFLVRHLAPTEAGLPIEIYVFSSDQDWTNYEAIQADIFDHILAVIPEFGLRVFQNPTGADFSALAAFQNKP